MRGPAKDNNTLPCFVSKDEAKPEEVPAVVSQVTPLEDGGYSQAEGSFYSKPVLCYTELSKCLNLLYVA